MASAVDPLGLVRSSVSEIRFDECVDATGFGVLYRGRHATFQGPVAVKCLRLAQLRQTNEQMRAHILARFHEEAKLLGQLAQGNSDIVRCLSAGELFAPATGERVPYLVLEWVDGRTLRADLDERRQRGLRGRSLGEALDLLESAVLALAHAHRSNVVHRDVRPEHLLLARTPSGTRLKVLDLGIAKMLSDEPVIGIGQDVTTNDGARLCSPAYGAPEQFSGDLGSIGPWTDVYALALVLLEVIHGDRARPAATPAEGLVKALDPRTGSPRASYLGIALPRAVEDLLARAVAQNPAERPPNAGAFWSDLRQRARASAPPVTDDAALAATAYDGEVGAALLKVRAMAAPGIPPSVLPSSAPEASSPFTGTMLMIGAPGGGVQLHQAPASSGPLSGGPSSGGPVSAPIPHPAPSALAASHVAPPLSPNAANRGLAMSSPLASSLGPGRVSPVAKLGAGQAHAPGPIGSADGRTSSRPPPAPAPAPAPLLGLDRTVGMPVQVPPIGSPIAPAPAAAPPPAPAPPPIAQGTPSVPPPVPMQGNATYIVLAIVLALALVSAVVAWFVLRAG